jgi:hypothetical protein
MNELPESERWHILLTEQHSAKTYLEKPDVASKIESDNTIRGFELERRHISGVRCSLSVPSWQWNSPLVLCQQQPASGNCNVDMALRFGDATVLSYTAVSKF